MAMNPRLLVPRATFDADAAAYLRAVEAADGQALETPVKKAVDDFFRGTKADGTFSALKASCILCGARTLAGALVPLAGTAPTNNNFVDADYNRETGLKGNGSTKYLDSNRAADADLESNHHISVFAVEGQAANQVAIGSYGIAATSYSLIYSAVSDLMQFYSLGNTASFSNRARTNLLGLSRASLESFSVRAGGESSTTSLTATGSLESQSHYVFAANNAGSVTQMSSARLAFYSIGESLDLALLDARVTALVAAIGAAL